LIPEGILLPLHESAIQTLPDNKTKDTLGYKFLEILKSPKNGEERSALLQSLFNGTYPKPNEPKKFYEAVQNYNDKVGEYLSKLF